MTKRAGLFLALAFAVLVPSIVGGLSREHAPPRTIDGPQLAAPVHREDARSTLAAAEEIEPLPSVNVRTLEPRADSELGAEPLASLARALRAGRVGPADWAAQLAACADESSGADVTALASRATNAELDVEERLAALELLRALHAEANVVLDPEAASEIAALMLEADGTRSWAAASALATFGDEASRAELYDQLDREGGAGSVALHGLRECARCVVLSELGARLALESDPVTQERFAAAAQGVARALGAREDRAAAGQAEPLFALARRDDLTPAARRRLLLAAASLGSARAEAEMCDVACDAKTDAELAREIANALRASPRRDAVERLEPRLLAANVDQARREELTATCDFLRASDSRATR